MNDGGTLYRWREDQRQYAPESVKHALIREDHAGVRDWWEPVCSLAEYLGVELREPDDKINVALVCKYVANSASWRGTVDTPLSNAARAAAMWLRDEGDRRRLRYLVACLNGTPALGPDVHLRRQRIEWMNEIEDILGLVRNR